MAISISVSLRSIQEEVVALNIGTTKNLEVCQTQLYINQHDGKHGISLRIFSHFH